MAVTTKRVRIMPPMKDLIFLSFRLMNHGEGAGEAVQTAQYFGEASNRWKAGLKNMEYAIRQSLN